MTNGKHGKTSNQSSSSSPTASEPVDPNLAISDFHDRANSFGLETARLIEKSFPSTEWEVTVSARSDSARSVIQATVPLTQPPPRGGTTPNPLAHLGVTIKCCLDSQGQYLAVENSTYRLVASIDKTPMVRVEYERGSRRKPAAHLHVHAHRGAFSHILSRLKHKTPHSLESLHLPLGGDRFRPCLEDFVQFLIEDCNFDHKPDWRDAVTEGRERWRRIQTRAVVRDAPSEAVDALQKMGYQVIPPEELVVDNITKLHTW
ncbi:hypothetical protein ACIGGF_12220 [Rhodococcus sp. NPDC078407]|uniref:hypothetical protein n=1 Tax=Rhodococcus sp. NPDC078407 TaxID=3364509 RepID=UPI0037C5D8D4